MLNFGGGKKNVFKFGPSHPKGLSEEFLNLVVERVDTPWKINMISGISRDPQGHATPYPILPNLDNSNYFRHCVGCLLN